MDDPLFDDGYPAKATVETTANGGGARKRASHTGDQMKPAASIILEMSDSSKELTQSRIDEAMSTPGFNIPRRGGKIFNRDDALMMPGESLKSYVWRMCTEGHTVADAFMTCACAQVGQIMLNSPSALYRMGLIAGGISMVLFLICGYWTIYQFIALYMEMKLIKVTDGSWWDTDGKHMLVVQYFTVMGFFLGTWAKVSCVIVFVIVIIGLLMTQINACANNMYFVDPSRPKREWALIYGGIMVFTMIFFPRFNHFRLANVIGLVTVLTMAIYIIIIASEKGVDYAHAKLWPNNSQEWFNGAAIWLTILGTHSVTFEILESMENTRHFKTSFSSAWLWAICVTVPHSILCNLVYGQMFKQLGSGADNIFALLGFNSAQEAYIKLVTKAPVPTSKYAMAIMMNMHQFIAYAIYGTSLNFVWEKLLRVHDKPWYIKMPLRIPLGALVWFLAILAPFYGAINALYASLAIPYLGFVLPSIAMMHHYRSRVQLENSVIKPYRWVYWAPPALAARLEARHPYLGLVVTPWFAMNLFMVLFFSGFGGTAIYYSVLLVKQYYQSFGAFAQCYACPKPLPPRPPSNSTGNSTGRLFF